MNQKLHQRAVAATAALALGAGLVLTATTTPSAATNDSPFVLSTHSLDFTGEGGGTLGYSASRVACDVNGDGFDDTLIGDPNWDRPNYENVGAGYVLFGSANPTGGSVADPAAKVARIDGPSLEVPSGTWIGWGSSCLGDVNGDGIDDFALGSGSRHLQETVVIFGNKNFQDVDLDFLGTKGFRISDPGAVTPDTDNFGYWVGEVGDVDGDGYADIGIGDLLADNNGRSSSGRVWVVRGGDSVADVNVATDTDRVLFSVDGAAANDRLATVAAAGDVNGDGLDDFVVSAYTAKPWGSAISGSGAAYVVFGNRAAQTIDLAGLGRQGFAIFGAKRGGDRLGVSVAAGGDINGDGLADLLVGSDGNSTSAKRGGVAVVFGSAQSATVITDPDNAAASVFQCADGAVDADCLATQKQPRGYWINGDADGRQAGWSVANLGDVNGDGVPDQVVGSYQNAGVWVAYGQAASTATVQLATDRDAGSLKVAHGSGRSVGNAGDHDGNGVNDMVFGNPGANTAGIVLLGDLVTELALSGNTTAAAGADVVLNFSANATVASAQAGLHGTITLSIDGAATACAGVQITGGVPTECTLSGLGAGSHTITAQFTPDSSGYATAEAEHTVVVAKAATPTPTTPTPATPTMTSKAALKAKPKVTVKKVKAGKRQVALIRLGQTTTGAWATGKVTVKYAGKTRTVAAKASQRGVVRVVLAKKAKYSAKAKMLTVRYLGNATTKSSAAVKVTVKVKRR